MDSNKKTPIVPYEELTHAQKQLMPKEMYGFMAEINGEQELPRITLNHFVDVFLPILTSFKKGEPVDQGPWMDVCGNVYTSVEVVDDKGNVVYKVPPLMARYNGDRKPNSFSIAQLSEQAQLKSNILPAMGSRFFQEHIGALISVGELNEESEQMWNKILIENGYSDLVTPQAAEAIAEDLQAKPETSTQDEEGPEWEESVEEWGEPD